MDFKELAKKSITISTQQNKSKASAIKKNSN